MKIEIQIAAAGKISGDAFLKITEFLHSIASDFACSMIVTDMGGSASESKPAIAASFRGTPFIVGDAAGDAKNCLTCRHFSRTFGLCQYAKDCDATFDLWQPIEHG